MLTRAQLRHYTEYGYIILQHAVPEGMLEPLREAANRVVLRARRGDWPHVRKVSENDIWGVSHLLHPELGEPIFAQYIASNVVIDVVGDMLSINPESRFRGLQLELVNMLVNPQANDYQINWHRDLVRGDLPPEKVRIELQKRQGGIQWNAALYDDALPEKPQRV